MNQETADITSAHGESSPEPRRPLISLASWVARTYDPNDAPHMNTVRRWVKRKLIQPAPQKQGREFFVDPAARYCPAAQDQGAA